MRRDDATTGLGSGAPRNATPYSVSMPTIFGTPTLSSYRRGPAGQLCFGGLLQILPRGDALGLPAALVPVALVHDRADVDDPLALLAGDLRPVVGVRGVRQVLVLAELLLDRLEQVIGADAPVAAGDRPLDRELLRAPHDVLDHGAGREVLEVQGLLVAVLVGHLEELVLVAGRVHVVDAFGDHALDGLLAVVAGRFELAPGDRQGRGEVLRENLRRAAFVGTLDLDFHVETAGAQDRGIDEILAVGGADHDHVLQGL